MSIAKRILFPKFIVNWLRWLKLNMPRKLYARTLIIIVAPMFLLQSVLVFVFMERHWNTVTQRLSAAVAGDIAAVVELVDMNAEDGSYTRIEDLAKRALRLDVKVLPAGSLPSPLPRPYFSILDQALSESIRDNIDQPFWIDTVGQSNYVEVRVQLADKIVQVFARRSQTYASNSHIFLIWMFGSSLVLILVAILFLRNQIKPILRLASAAEEFGKGREVPDFKPSGAQEVRRASRAFLLMRRRIERQIEQRTTMLAGVSHDLRTILTRFKLQLAFLGDGPDVRDLNADVDEMQAMLEAYLSFIREDAEESSTTLNLDDFLSEVLNHIEVLGGEGSIELIGSSDVQVRVVGFRRCVINLVSNACRVAKRVHVNAVHEDDWLIIGVEDDGPGIPEEERENVFRPFYRLDASRNQDAVQSGSGLGLAIAMDVAKAHGGTMTLGESAFGGLRAELRIPV